MHDRELRWIEKPSCVEYVHGNVVADIRASIGEIESAIRRSEAAVGSGYTSMRLFHSQSRARGHLDHDARLVAKFCWRSSGNNLERLNGIKRNLIGKDFALLIGDRLTVEGERVLRVVADSVEETVGIRGDARR